MKKFALAAVLAIALVQADGARAAQEWGLLGEEVARFEAKVVDILCELTGDCPAGCGKGKRQLGLLTDEGRLVMPIKNSTPFSGSVDELIDFCGKRVLADGLFATNRGYTVYALQFVKQLPDGKWRRANRFLPKWAKSFGFKPGGPESKRWFRNDPRIKALVAEEGKLGLGPAVDKKYFSEQQ